MATGLALLLCPPAGTALRLQGAWTGWLLAATALAAGYPWLRADPLSSALSLWGLDPAPGAPTGALVSPWLLAPAVTLGLASAAFRLAGRHAERAIRWLPPVLPVAALVLVGVCAPTERLLGGAPVVLGVERPAWSIRPAAGALRSVAVDAALSNSTGLPRGTPVAWVRVRSAGGRVEELPLRSGIELDEWAARRPDVARALGATPPAWTSWIPPGGGFFAQRYRARLELPGNDASEIEVRLAGDLPESLSLALYHLEVAR